MYKLNKSYNMGTTTIYLDDETLEILKYKKKNDNDFNLSRLIQEIIKESGKDRLSEEGLLGEINRKKVIIHTAEKELEVLELQLKKLRDREDRNRILKITEKEFQKEQQDKWNAKERIFDSMTDEDRAYCRANKISFMEWCERKLNE